MNFSEIKIDCMRQIDAIIVKMRAENTNFKEFVEYSVINEKNSWLIAWILSKYTEKYPNSLDEYVDIFISKLENIKKDGQIRQILIILRYCTLSDTQSSQLYDYCFALFENNKIQSSVRYQAFMFMFDFAKNYPELRQALFLLFDRYKDSMSKGIAHSMNCRIGPVSK